MGSNNVNNSTAHDGDDKGSVSLCDLPVELVIEIVAGLPARYLVLVCRLVCKQWRCIVDSQSLWVQKCHIDSVAVPTMKDLDYRHLHFHNPYGRNLLKNWNGEDGMKHWRVTAEGGDGFQIEDNDSDYSVQPLDEKALGCECRKWWATSYHLCLAGQYIDLLREGCSADVIDTLKPDIVVSVWTAARRDCASEFKLQVKLKSATHETIDAFTEQRQVAQWQSGEWVQIKHIFSDYPDGVRNISYNHGGQDSQFWAGYYGPKIAAPSVRFELKH